ncbi:MAG: exodeoxyribonuclease VII large subunit [Propioniciclava sp.]
MALESSAENPQPLRAVVGALKAWVERTQPIWVEGQIIQVKRRAGYAVHFLTLRDRLAEVSVSVSVATAVLDAAGPVLEGVQVTAQLRATVYPANGSLTFECRELRPSGEGRLLAHLEQRKRALQAEGLFAPELKRRLPFLPRAVGLITGKDSAAERDVVATITQRWPSARIEVRHTLVQGPQSVDQVREALAALDLDGDVEVIIVARGGGSLEDLLPFSDEGLVRSVHACMTPVVSAIGHETDTPILDLVADIRASTPTDAAKRVVPDAAEEVRVIATGRDRLRAAVTRRVHSEQQRLTDLRSRPVLQNPAGTVDLHRERLDAWADRLARAVGRRLEREQDRLTHDLQRIRTLSPRATLHRGYAILSTDDGNPVASVSDVATDDIVIARIADGEIAAAVIDTDLHTGPEESHE